MTMHAGKVNVYTVTLIEGDERDCYPFMHCYLSRDKAIAAVEAHELEMLQMIYDPNGKDEPPVCAKLTWDDEKTVAVSDDEARVYNVTQTELH